MPCVWEGNRRAGVALATRRRLQWFIHLCGLKAGALKLTDHKIAGHEIAGLKLPDMKQQDMKSQDTCCFGWWRGTVVERRSLAGELSLSCDRPAADG